MRSACWNDLLNVELGCVARSGAIDTPSSGNWSLTWFSNTTVGFIWIIYARFGG